MIIKELLLIALLGSYCLQDVSGLYDPENKYKDNVNYRPTDCNGPDILYLYEQVHKLFMAKLVITDVNDFYNLCFGLHMIVDLYHMCKNRFEGKKGLNPWVEGDCEAGQVNDKALDKIRVAKVMPTEKKNWPTWILWPAGKNQGDWPDTERPWPIGQNWPEFPKWSTVVAWPVLDFGRWPSNQCYPRTQSLETTDKGPKCDETGPDSQATRKMKRSINSTQESMEFRLSTRYNNPQNLTHSDKYSWISGINESLIIPFNNTELKNFITDLTNPNLSRKGRRRVKRGLNVQQHMKFVENLAASLCERDFFIKKEFPVGSKLVQQFSFELFECYGERYLKMVVGARNDGNMRRIFHWGCCALVDMIVCLRKSMLKNKCNRRCRRYIEFMLNSYVVPFAKREFCTLFPQYYDYDNIGNQKKQCANFKKDSNDIGLNLNLELKSHAGMKPLPNVEIIIFMVILVMFIAFRMKRC